MSDLKNRVEVLIQSERTPTLFVHSAYDDFPLTIEAFRLLAHLSRRAGNENHVAQTTYEKMGEVCFRATWPNSTASALRKRAMAAMKELVGFGLVRVESTTGRDGGQGANRYILTHCTEWIPEYQAGPETTVRGTGVHSSGPPQSGRADSPPVRSSGPPQSTPADPPSPAERTHKVILIEGNPYRRYDRVCQNSENPSKPDLELSNLEPPPAILLPDEPKLEPESPPSKTKKVPPRRSKKETARTKSVPKYYPEEFEQFWGDYKTFCIDVEASVALNQTRWEAVESWDNLLAVGEALEAILEGSSWYFECKRQEKKRKGEALGVSHAFRYLRDRKWEAALEHKQAQHQAQQSTTAQCSSLTGAYDRLRVKSQINDFLKMLNWPAVLPPEWQQRTGKLLVSELPPEHAPDFLAMLEREYQALTQAS